MPVKVPLPQMGEGVIEATVTKWLKNEGDEVKEYDPLVEINTDKVDTEIPSPTSGTVLKILVGEGNTAPVNSVLAWIGKPGEKIPEDSSAEPNAAAKPPADKPAVSSVQPVQTAPAVQPLPAAPSAQPVRPFPVAQPVSLPGIMAAPPPAPAAP